MSEERKNALDVLRERGFVEQVTDEEGIRRLLETPQSIYIGFDPTADSLHIGSMIPILVLMHLQRCGHRAIGLVGGATGMIGDPSGKSEERVLQSDERVGSNLTGIRAQLEKFLDLTGESGNPPAVIRDNADWTKDITMLEWLRDIGKLFTVNYMVAKESIRRRFEDREQGISFTEFSYMLLQAHDFYQLFVQEGCRIQMGGRDQWGNITAGIDLIRRKTGEQAYGLTAPLLESSTGQKFGKSEKGAIFLDEARTSIWDFYQYFVRAEDADVIKYLKYFTFLPMEEIADLEKEVQEHPERRTAQKRLAWEFTAIVHGADQADRMEKGAEALYSGNLGELDKELLREVFSDGPSLGIPMSRIKEGGPCAEFFAETGVVKSKGEAKRLLKQGALYINNVRVNESDLLSEAMILPSGMIVLRKGKREYMLAEVSGE